jgi:hypothetical protein
MRKVCVVPIFGDYDTLKEPFVSEGWKYICISDRHHKSDVWKTKVFKSDLTDKRKSGYVLTQLHRLIDFDIACVVGGQIQINDDLNKYITEDFDFISLNHPSRNCVYKEAQACILLDKDNPKTIAKQMYKYLENGYPVNNGMIQTGVTFRKDNNLIRTFMNHWWHEIEQGSHRDQLSFNYVLDKYKINHKEISSNLLNKQFKLHNHL